MAKKLYTEGYISGIANAIRSKNGSNDTYKVSEMADAIDNISIPVLIAKTITAPGTYVAANDNAGGYSQVAVNISSYDGVSF